MPHETRILIAPKCLDQLHLIMWFKKILPLLWLSTFLVMNCNNTKAARTDVSLVLVKTLQNQLNTCMNQNAELVKRACNGGQNTTNKIGSSYRRLIAFHAGLSKTVQNLPHNYKLVFDKIYLNEGKAYDPHTGVFTCPRDGIYVFHWTILTATGKYFLTDFMLNGKVVGRTYPSGASANRGASSTVILKLKRGDKTWIEPHKTYTGQLAYAGWSFFSGHGL